MGLCRHWPFRNQLIKFIKYVEVTNIMLNRILLLGFHNKGKFFYH